MKRKILGAFLVLMASLIAFLSASWYVLAGMAFIVVGYDLLVRQEIEDEIRKNWLSSYMT